MTGVTEGPRNDKAGRESQKGSRRFQVLRERDYYITEDPNGFVFIQVQVVTGTLLLHTISHRKVKLKMR